MSATALHPFGSPLGSSTRGKGLQAHNRERSEFEARLERAAGSPVDGYHFDVEYEGRGGDIEILWVRAPNNQEAIRAAIEEARGTSLRFLRIDPDWTVVFLKDGRFFDRQGAYALVEKTKEAV